MTGRWLALCSILCALAPLGKRPAAAHERVACDELALAPIPGTTITLARLNPASTNPVAPEHCEVVGSIGARTGVDGKAYAIGLHLRMPVAWNGRFLFQGGGGVDGFLGDALGSTGPGQTDNAVSRGYAVVSTDGGHSFDALPYVFMTPPDLVAADGLVSCMFGFDFDRDAPGSSRRPMCTPSPRTSS
jgi:feruloyl esterase